MIITPTLPITQLFLEQITAHPYPHFHYKNADSETRQLPLNIAPKKTSSKGK
jgi:hypothetical protein